MLLITLACLIITLFSIFPFSKKAQAGHCQISGCLCVPPLDAATRAVIIQQHLETRAHFNAEFTAWENFLLNVFFTEHFLPALVYMTNQLVATASHQMLPIGMFFDGAHQMEVQALFRKKLIEAHKDYHPSHSMCVFGTNMRSMADADRRRIVTTNTLAQRSFERQMGAKDSMASEGNHLDKSVRLEHFRNRYCDIHDNGEDGLSVLCPNGSAPATTVNKDINYSDTVERALTLEVDFTDGNLTDDEQDIMALANNLYSHDVFLRIPESAFIFGSRQTSPFRDEILDIRQLVAKRSVAENSFNNIVAMKSMGSPAAKTPLSSVDTAEFMTIILQELGIPGTEIPELLGGVEDGQEVRPSYYAQMNVFTKAILQNPSFYVDLYEKPVNVERKSATLQAIKLMQDYDTLESALRTEAMLAVLLETKLMEEQGRVANKLHLTDTEGVDN